jgi:hypothetical protein
MKIQLLKQEHGKYLIKDRHRIDRLKITSDVDYSFAYFLKITYNKISKPNYSVFSYAGELHYLQRRDHYYFG